VEAEYSGVDVFLSRVESSFRELSAESKDPYNHAENPETFALILKGQVATGKLLGVLRLLNCSAKRSSFSAQDHDHPIFFLSAVMWATWCRPCQAYKARFLSNGMRPNSG
jgi:hypothetical protein